MSRKNTRGASTLTYGLMIGLVSIAALAATATTGVSVNALFGSVSDQMRSALAPGSTNSNNDAQHPETEAEPTPTPQTDTFAPCNGLTALAQIPGTDGSTVYLCSGRYSVSGNVAAAEEVMETSCIAESDVQPNTRFSHPNNSSVEYRSIRYMTDLTPTGPVVQFTSEYHYYYPCADSTCTASLGSPSTSGSGGGSRRSQQSTELCVLNVEAPDFTGVTWPFGTTIFIRTSGGVSRSIDYGFQGLGVTTSSPEQYDWVHGYAALLNGDDNNFDQFHHPNTELLNSRRFTFVHMDYPAPD